MNEPIALLGFGAVGDNGEVVVQRRLYTTSPVTSVHYSIPSLEENKKVIPVV